jgi:pyruvate dehydrogenase E1 component alpha subunit
MNFLVKENTKLSHKSLDRQQKMFFDLLRIRRVEEEIAWRYPEQQMRCPTHLCIGQEAIAVGVCSALSKEDYVLSAHRAHAHYLAKGGNLKKFIAELYGKKSGCAGGRGGSMHLIDLEAGFLGCVPIVGSTIPLGVGAAFGAKQQNKDNVTIVFLGDAATEEGVFYESLNFAKFHNLPVLFVCENNSYSVNTRYEHRRLSTQKLSHIVESFGIETTVGDGQNCSDVSALTVKLVKEIKETSQPKFLELNTYLCIEHCGPGAEALKPQEELTAWIKRDPVDLYKKFLSEQNIIDSNRVLEFEKSIKEEIEDAFNFAINSPFPERETLMTNVFAKA